ncbi:MAG TPA: archease [Anaerolineales bacterium]|nr:archease [Anaerolineales bacterium]
MYEEIDHTADWALRLQARDMAELCQQAALAMLATCGARAGAVEGGQRVISLEGADRESLLVRWLEEVLFTLDARHRLPTRIEVDVTADLRLTARWQEAVLASVDKPIKAVTYAGLAVEEEDGRLQATVTFDV